MPAQRWRETFARQVLLSCGLTVALQAGFQIQDSRLYFDDEIFVIRGVTYGNAPIGSSWSDVLSASGCLPARDFPLIAALGANTVRTLAMAPPEDRAFRKALEGSDLYWLAGFPLDRFHDPARTLSPDTEQGRSLRARILGEFREYVEAWKSEERLIAFVFGDEVTTDYGRKFGGSVSDFYTLLREAAGVVRESGSGSHLITTAVSQLSHIGAVSLGAADSGQPGLSFWSLNRLGTAPVGADLQELRSRTRKPLLISAFGVDAFDQANFSEDAEAQARTVGEQARRIEAGLAGDSSALIGGVAAAFVDEWWRGGPNPAQHGTSGKPHDRFPDRFLNEAWLGLFGLAPTGNPGLDRLRVRDAYFALAAEWDGSPPAELSQGGPPRIDDGGVANMAGGLPLLAPGGLMAIQGGGFAPFAQSAAGGDLPMQFGAVSACMEGLPIPLFFADTEQIRGQVPWSLRPGTAKVIVYRGGLMSNVEHVEIASHAPGIFAGGVLQAGRPCPVDESNGVRPGSYLEIYGTGLGRPQASPVTGVALGEVASIIQTPRVELGSRELPVIFSALLPAFVGVYQTNAQVPEDFPASAADLRLTQDGVSSSPYRLQVISARQRPGFTLLGPAVSRFVLQSGGPPQSHVIQVVGANSFCDPVEFRVSGLPPGVQASIPPSLPGQSVLLTLEAGPAAPQAEDEMFVLTGFSGIPETASRSFQVTVLPSLGNVAFRVVSGGWLSTVPGASFSMQGRLLYEVQGGGAGRGFNFLTVDPKTGALGPLRSFDTWASEEQVEALENYLQSLPEGEVVLGAIADDGWLLITDRTRRILRETLASQLIDFLEYQYSWAIISRKGAEVPIEEGLRPNGVVVLDSVLSFPMQ